MTASLPRLPPAETMALSNVSAAWNLIQGPSTVSQSMFSACAPVPLCVKHTIISEGYTVPMKWPQEVEDEIQRLKKICRDDQDLIIDGPLSKDGGWRVYLQNAEPLVEYIRRPSTR